MDAKATNTMPLSRCLAIVAMVPLTALAIYGVSVGVMAWVYIIRFIMS